MRAISLHQPFASLWLSPHKLHETRHWLTNIRGPVIVHASKKIETEVSDRVDFLCRSRFGTNWRTDLPRGALLGQVHIIDCLRAENIYPVQPSTDDDFACGHFKFGRYGWRRAAEYRIFERPILFKGKQGFFNVPDELIAGAMTT